MKSGLQKGKLKILFPIINPPAPLAFWPPMVEDAGWIVPKALLSNPS
jgi:hypothetical protein